MHKAYYLRSCVLLGAAFCCSLFIFGFKENGYAAAWLKDAGKAELIQTLNYYQTDSVVDSGGNVTPQESFSKYDYSLYAEYGLNESITIGLNPSFQKLIQGSDVNSGLADTEVFLRHKILKTEGAVLSLQPLIKIPGPYSEDDRPLLGQSQLDAELRLLYGQNLTLWGKHHFINLEAAYRTRMEMPGDEYRFDATFGLKPTQDWMILSQIFSTFAVDNTTMNRIFISNASNYDLVKGQMSFVWSYREDIHLQAGIFQHLYARNTGDGGGVVVSVWRNF